MTRRHMKHNDMAVSVLVFAGAVILLQLVVPAVLIAAGHTELVHQLDTTLNALTSLVTFSVGGVVGYFFTETRG